MEPDPVVEVAVDCRSLLGEGVTWDADAQTLLWVDVDGRVLHRLAADRCATRARRWSAPRASSCHAEAAASSPSPAVGGDDGRPRRIRRRDRHAAGGR